MLRLEEQKADASADEIGKTWENKRCRRGDFLPGRTKGGLL